MAVPKLPPPLTLRRQSQVNTFSESELGNDVMRIIIEQGVRDHYSLRGTTNKQELLQLLLWVMREIVNEDKKVADHLHGVAFKEICNRLQITECIVDKILRSLDLCCSRRWLACFGC